MEYLPAMVVPAARSLAVVAAIVSGLATGASAAGSATTEPPEGSAAGQGCAEIGALLDTSVAIGTALALGDAAALETSLAALRDAVDAAAATAPAEIAAEIETLVGTVDATVTSLEGVDLSDVDAVLAVFE